MLFYQYSAHKSCIFMNVLHSAGFKIWKQFLCSLYRIGCSFKFLLKVGVEESTVNAPWLADHGWAVYSNLTFCVVCVFTLQTDEWCAFTINSPKSTTLRRNLNEHLTSILFLLATASPKLQQVLIIYGSFICFIYFITDKLPQTSNLFGYYFGTTHC
jgi:hypothetical protein